MSYISNIISAANAIDVDLKSMGFDASHTQPVVNSYDNAVTNKALRKKTERLFIDGHHSQAVEEAYKLLDNIVKKKAELSLTDLTGSSLMQNAFSPKKPILKLNECISTSEQNEQAGYMQILAGCMTGIRNPRAHDSAWEDTEHRALQLLMFADHLIERVLLAEKVSDEK